MSSRFVRVASKEEWDQAVKARALPTNRDAWADYGPGEVVFLHQETVPFHWLLSYVQQTFDREPGEEAYLILVDFPHARGLTLRADTSSTYPEAVVHPGPIPIDGDTKVRCVATFHRHGVS